MMTKHSTPFRIDDLRSSTAIFTLPASNQPASHKHRARYAALKLRDIVLVLI